MIHNIVGVRQVAHHPVINIQIPWLSENISCKQVPSLDEFAAQIICQFCPGKAGILPQGYRKRKPGWV